MVSETPSKNWISPPVRKRTSLSLELYRLCMRNEGRMRGCYRIAQLLQRYNDRRPYIFRCRVFDEIDVWLRSDDHNIEGTCYIQGSYGGAVLDLVRNFRGAGRVMYDIGANIGLYSLLASAPGCRPCTVYAFEPTSSTRERLIRNIALNGAEEFVHPIAFGLSDREGAVEVLVPLADSGLVSLHAKPGDGPLVKDTLNLAPLDKLVQEKGLKPPDFIKMDVEGHELFAIRGAKHTLQEHRPVLLLEYNEHAREAGWSFADLQAELSPLGYVIVNASRVEEGPIDTESAVAGTDLLCLPRNSPSSLAGTFAPAGSGAE